MRSKWNQLTQDRADIIREGKELFAQAEGRDLTDDEKQHDDEIKVRLDAVDAELADLNEASQRERNTPAVQTAYPNGPPSQDAPQQAIGVGLGRTFADLFGPDVADMGGFKDREEFFGLVHKNQYDPRLIQATAGEGTGADGGFLVPTQLVAELLDASLENEIVRPRADVTPMSSATKKVAGFDASDSSSNLYGGISGEWVAEGGTITAETPRLRLIELVSKKLAVLAQVTNELLADSSYGRELERAMVKAIAWFMDLAFLSGTGAGEPQGVLNSPSLVTVAKEAAQAADTIVYANLAKMLARLHPGCVNNAIWICNAGTRAELLQLTVAIGTAGAFVPALTESAGQFRMLTLPVVFTEKVPVLGDEGDILLADFSQYYVGLRQNMSLARSEHVGFTSDTTYFRGLLRADGQPKWAAAYTPKNGESLSWAVTLAERA